MSRHLDVVSMTGAEYDELEARAEAADEANAALARVWDALGITSYEQAGGKEISEIVAAIRAERDEARAIVVRLRKPDEAIVRLRARLDSADTSVDELQAHAQTLEAQVATLRIENERLGEDYIKASARLVAQEGKLTVLRTAAHDRR